MKFPAFFLTITLVIATLASAATQEEETRFANAIRGAYTKGNREAVIALNCWDNVSGFEREAAEAVISYVSGSAIKSVRYRSIDLLVDHVLGRGPLETFTWNLQNYRTNLAIIKQIEIEYQHKGDSNSIQLYIGEKNGKLMVANIIRDRSSSAHSHTAVPTVQSVLEEMAFSR